MFQKTSKKAANQGLKVQFFIMSLMILFLLIAILNIDLQFLRGTAQNSHSLRRNIFAGISLFCALGSYILSCGKQYTWNGATKLPYKIKSIKNENYEYLTFLTTYIIPLIGINWDDMRCIAVLIILLFIIGYIFVRMDLYYGNPTLALFGYRLYRAEIEGFHAPDGVILITKDTLTANSSFKWIKLDQFVWLAKEISK